MKEITKDTLEKLKSFAEQTENNSVLFSFDFRGLFVRGIFFGATVTITIGISDKNVAWQCDISNRKLSEKIPKESYRVIGETLTDENGIRSNEPFFDKLIGTLINLSDPQSADKDEIILLLKNCRTKDKKYDSEGDLPFFDHWRRVKPSKNSLSKIQRYFGNEIRNSCYLNGVTAVWAAEPKENSLIFLNHANPNNLVNEIQHQI